RPSLSISVPNAICTLLDAVAVKVISALKKRVSACRGGRGTSFDDSHPAYGGGLLVTIVVPAFEWNARQAASKKIRLDVLRMAVFRVGEWLVLK
ncbi:MAG: hypothetical protein WCP12_17535, partial [bacterium]